VKLDLQTDRTLIRAAARSTRYLAASFIAPAAARRDMRPPVNVALVLDRSGSMAGEKIALARRAVEQALRLLQSRDRFSLVVYDDVVDVLVESTPATADSKARALGLLEKIEARSATDLSGGWLRGCEQVALHAREDWVNRCLLLTDGLANRGITDRGELTRHAAALRERGVHTSTFGVGADFDERLLRDMASAAGGHFYFIEFPAQIPDLLTSELGEALEVVMRGAVLEVVLPSGARAESLHRYRVRRREDSNELRVELGDLVSEQEVSVVVKLEFPTGESGAQTGVIVSFTDREGGVFAPSEALRWTWAGHAENDEQPRNRVVDRQVAALYAARARAEATECNRAGDYERARHVLSATAKRIRSYAGNDPELNRIADELLREQEEVYSVPMAPMQLKSTFFAAQAMMEHRSPSGQARRGLTS
jgi:Ca-activated chloride channel homolog